MNIRAKNWFISSLIMFAIAMDASAQPPSGKVDVELDAVQPGLVAHYRSLVDGDATLHRIDAKPAFALGYSNPHPRIPAGAFEVEWTGLLFLGDIGPIKFDAFVCGELSIEVDGVTVLKGRGERETASVVGATGLDRGKGLYRIQIKYKSLPDLPARLQIGWQGPMFSREPLPAWHLKHVPAELPKAVVQEQRVEQARIAVAKFGCARCHSNSFPSLTEPPPGPSLADIGQRIGKDWLVNWLADPHKFRGDARMPSLFADDRTGYVERWLVADHLLRYAAKPPAVNPSDHRMGRRLFVSLGCGACHFLPDAAKSEQVDLQRTSLTGLGDRFSSTQLAAFLLNPHGRYPDNRMPRVPMSNQEAQEIAAFLLLWSPPSKIDASEAPKADEIAAVAKRLRVPVHEVHGALVREKRCAECHTGLGSSIPASITISNDDRGCLSGKSGPRFEIDAATREAIKAYRAISDREKHASPFVERQRQVERLGCLKCHQRDSDRPPPIEVVGSTLGGAWLQNVPYQRTPRLIEPHQKYLRSHLETAIRDGVTGLRPGRYTYRMPAFGPHATTVVQALAQGDGELPEGADPKPFEANDPTLATLNGSSLVGFQGYSCVSCHIWNGQAFSEPDPGAIGTELTRITGRLRRDWFERYLEGPARSHPGTPMPAIFIKGEPALLKSALDGDPAKQKEAMWAYFALGKNAPSPKPAPPLPVLTPAAGEPPLVAQIPVRLPDNTIVESICVLYSNHDLIVYDVGALSPTRFYTGARLSRGVQGRLRTFVAEGTVANAAIRPDPPLQLVSKTKTESVEERALLGFDRVANGIRIRYSAKFQSGIVHVEETIRSVPTPGMRRIAREHRFSEVPAGFDVRFGDRADAPREGKALLDELIDMSMPSSPTPLAVAVLPDAGPIGGSLTRPGYRAILYPRPKTVTGEDRVMPTAIAADPKSGRVFFASLKTGELLTVDDPTDDGARATYRNYARGLFQEAFSMLADPGELFVLHRRNLTKIVDADGDGFADRFDRVLGLPHGISDTYDYGYGLARDKNGALVYSYAPYGKSEIPGAGGALRLVPGKTPQEIAFGFRNPLGWTAGPDGEIFATDNQGEWVATNKLCHITEGRYYGFPNRTQQQHAKKPFGKTAIWVPYAWAKSINGVTYDNTGGKFGPFAGQIFMAELMFGGAIIRANLEKVNGEYQGACFPFWGQGLLGPVCLTFDPKGRMWVGGITEPGWMAQPDRGALFRIDFTGQTPFEMKSIHVRPQGFRIEFTDPVDAKTARQLTSYHVENYRYEYTGSYGSPELDRTQVRIEKIEVAGDGKSVELTTSPLVADRVYMISARGVKSSKGESLVQPTGAYTLNEIPK